MATIAEIATSSDDFNILVAALQFVDAELDSSDLVAALSDAEGTFTVFAPTDAAFVQLALDSGYDGDTSDEGAVTTFLATTYGAETLFSVITYHVLGDVQDAATLAGQNKVTTLNGEKIKLGSLPTLIDKEPDLLDPSLLTTDIAADNGLIHSIDRVLLPVDLAGNDAQTIGAIVAESGGTFDNNGGDFDLLLNAALAAELVGALTDDEADLTVFAPTDAAFVSLAQSLGFEGEAEGGAFRYIVNALDLLGQGDPIPLLTEILTYHITGESLQSSEVLAETQFTMLNSGTVERDGTTLMDQDPDLPDPSLIALDILASNGIIHGIDEVLLPLDVEVGGGNSDFIIGGRRKQDINTGEGADMVHGAGGKDVIRLGDGADLGIGGNGADALFGGDGRDTLLGGRSGDFLHGGDGDDELTGGRGRDILVGGDGSDNFVFQTDGHRDFIRDADEDEDTLDLTDFGFASFDALSDAADIRQKGDATKVDFGNGIVLTLRDFDVDDLEAIVIL